MTTRDPSLLSIENADLRARNAGMTHENALLRARCEIAERECAQLRAFAAKVTEENAALNARLVILRGAMDGAL
jgi:hypothetical protein